VPGLIDLLSIDDSQMKTVAVYHLVVNLTGLAVFTVSFWLRLNPQLTGDSLPVALSALGIVLIGIGGWLGGEMVYVKGMAVEAVEVLSKRRQAR
jgi:uncharacterized membrane protein